MPSPSQKPQPQQGGANTPPQQAGQSTPQPQQPGTTPRVIRDWAAF
jgi:hypothetical protein